MIVVGGTYSEVCFEPMWEQIYGSGLRAVQVLLSTEDIGHVRFVTSGDEEETGPYLDYINSIYPGLEIQIHKTSKSLSFYYDYPLRMPTILPRPDVVEKNSFEVKDLSADVLQFGMIESAVIVSGRKVVYDPQSPAKPVSFRDSGSSAQQLAIIVNRGEAEELSGESDLTKIQEAIFAKEQCDVLVVKDSARGAHLFVESQSEAINIPVYMTNNVWSIGSGDVFSTTFAYHWFNGCTPQFACSRASRATAQYCNTKNLNVLRSTDQIDYQELIIKERPATQIYLAGPFFTMSERWVINEAWKQLKSFGLKVFSPFHDVGHGRAEDVVHKDIQGLNNSDIVFAIVDGLDSGTLFEIGYAICQQKKVIAFTQNEGEEPLKMLDGTGCIIEEDFTTALYKVYWESGKF